MSEIVRKSYPSDLTDAQWNLLAPLIPPKIGRGETSKVNLREVVNGTLYFQRTGCQWDYLPHDFPPKDTVYYYFKKWKEDGTLDHMLTSLHQQVRVAEGRESTPSAGSVDSQTIKTTEILPFRLPNRSRFWLLTCALPTSNMPKNTIPTIMAASRRVRSNFVGTFQRGGKQAPFP